MKDDDGPVARHKAQRLALATQLLQGQCRHAIREGYDPAGLQRQAVLDQVRTALDMADLLIMHNEVFDTVED